MKIRESGMPERNVWEEFFNPKNVLETLGLNSQIVNVAEFGCGYGTFTIPSAQVIKGKIYALDIEPAMIQIINEETQKQGLSNVQTILRDFMVEGSSLANGSVDYVMLFNILHLKNPNFLLKEAWRILRKEGKLGIIHWNYDSQTPRGPSMDIRPKPGQCIQWAEGIGFCNPILYDLKPHHYGIVLTK
ncbi:MAG: class I SAM-dependent methyltransferase [Candidatus Omnitrophica bacterium]|nr:class I SAM-dependent methyltransferase [Candidatus Omnitrophota bacterium]